MFLILIFVPFLEELELLSSPQRRNLPRIMCNVFNFYFSPFLEELELLSFTS